MIISWSRKSTLYIYYFSISIQQFVFYYKFDNYDWDYLSIQTSNVESATIGPLMSSPTVT